MAKARGLYDAPFTRNLAAFDCEVQFDWKTHLSNMIGTLPPSMMATVERLQSIHHRVSLDGRQAVVSAKPEHADFSGIPQGSQLEQVLIAMVSGGLSAWIPSSTNVILPVGTTGYRFEKLPSGFKIYMTGPKIQGALLVTSDLRVTSGVMDLPQPLRFTTEFKSGSEGYLLSSVLTEPMSGTDGEAAFEYTYQVVDGFQLPAQVTVKPAMTGEWRYDLTDCKVVKFVKIQVGLPKQ